MYTAHSAPVVTNLVFGAIVVIALFTILLFALVAGAERLAMPWKERR
jgi:ABC-type nitrate/sulfonate/bicarbonate transport system permease component